MVASEGTAERFRTIKARPARERLVAARTSLREVDHVANVTISTLFQLRSTVKAGASSRVQIDMFTLHRMRESEHSGDEWRCTLRIEKHE